MGKPKFSLINDTPDSDTLLDHAGEALFAAAKVAELVARPDLAQQIRHTIRHGFIDHKNLYSIIPLPVIRELYDVMQQIHDAAHPLVNDDHELLPEALSLINDSNEDVLVVSEDSNGNKIYSLSYGLNQVEILKDYFSEALKQNREIEYGKYT